MKRYRIGRKLLQGFGALGAGFLTYKAVTSEEGLDIYNVGIARFGRAAVAVSLILKSTTAKLTNTPSVYKNFCSLMYQLSCPIVGRSPWNRLQKNYDS